MNWITKFEKNTKNGKKHEGFLLPINDFKNFLKRTETESMVIAYLSVNKGRRKGAPIGALYENLQGRYNADEITKAVENLIADAWLTLYIDGPFDGTAKIDLSHTLEVSLINNNAQLLNSINKKVSKEDRCMLRAYSKLVNFKMRIISRDDWIEFSMKFIKNSKENWVKSLATESLSPLYAAMSLMTGILSIMENEPVEVRSLCHLFAYSQVECEKLFRKLTARENHKARSKVLDLINSPIRGKHLILSESAMSCSLDVDKEVFYDVPDTLVCHRKERIHPRKLFYNNQLNKDIKVLKRLVRGKNFRRFSNKMKKNGYNGGFTVMLSGAPGTGKTELVLQLALETNRDLLSFDLSKQRDMYYGESEKRIKEVFDVYREISKDPINAPILFFNESDGLFQSRSVHESTTGRTENSIQTILLNELEQFNGLLVCTTNTPESMDNAYNRRFLFKLKIDLPEPNVRCQLLRYFFPEIDLRDCVKISKKHVFTGADLMNIQKQIEIEQIVSRKTANISSNVIEEFLTRSVAKLGRATNKNRKPIGFTNN